MKKILLILLAAAFAFSAFTLSACDDKGAGETSDQGIIFEPDSDLQNSSSKNNVTSSTNGQTSITTSSSSATETPSSSVGGGATTSPTPQKSASFSFSASITGSGYTVTPTTPDATLAMNVRLAINLINNIKTVDGTTSCMGRIQVARTAYNELNVTEKNLVANYQELVNAENAYDRIAAETFVALVNSLSTSFAVSNSYSAGLNQGVTLYNSLSAAQKSATAAKKSELDGLKTRYDDAVAAKVITDLLATLPDDVSAITAEHKVAVRQLKNLYAAATSAQKNIVAQSVANAETKITAYVNKLNADFPEHEFIYMDDKESVSDFFHVNGSLSGTGDGGPIDFNGRSLTEGGQLGEIYFTSNGAGILSLYVSGHEETGDIEVKIDGTLIETVHVIGAIEVSGSGRQEPINFYEVNLPRGGRVTLTKTNGTAILFAVVFF